MRLPFGVLGGDGVVVVVVVGRRVFCFIGFRGLRELLDDDGLDCLFRTGLDTTLFLNVRKKINIEC